MKAIFHMMKQIICLALLLSTVGSTAVFAEAPKANVQRKTVPAPKSRPAAEEAAIQLIQKYKGRITFDKTTVGHPVIRLEVELAQMPAVKVNPLASLKHFPKLQMLKLNRSYNVKDEHLVVLKPLTELKSLQIQHAQRVSDAGLAHLKGLKNLKEFSLHAASKVTDKGIAHLKGLTQLTSLELYQIPKLTSIGLTINDLVNLEKLTISGANIRSVELAGLKKLKVIDLDTCNQLETVELLNMDSLSYLLVTGCSAMEIFEIAGVPKLRKLNLWKVPKLKGSELRWIGRLTGLQELAVSSKQITDADLAHLKTLTKLRFLRLDSCEKLTGSGFSHFQKFPKLRYLSVVDCPKLEKKALPHLMKLTQLRDLFITKGATFYTPKDLQKLKQSLPKCDICEWRH